MHVFIWILIALAGAAGLWFFAVRPALRKTYLPPLDATCEITERGGETVRHECGHVGHQLFKISVWGRPMIEAKQEGSRKFCADCLLVKVREDFIRCAICGEPIWPGQPVALIVDTMAFSRRAWRTIIDEQIVCCMGWDCEAGPGFVGHWTGKDIKSAFRDGRTMIGHVAATGEPTHVAFGGDKEDT